MQQNKTTSKDHNTRTFKGWKIFRFFKQLNQTANRWIVLHFLLTNRPNLHWQRLYSLDNSKWCFYLYLLTIVSSIYWSGRYILAGKSSPGVAPFSCSMARNLALAPSIVILFTGRHTSMNTVTTFSSSAWDNTEVHRIATINSPPSAHMVSE